MWIVNIIMNMDSECLVNVLVNVDYECFAECAPPSLIPLFSPRLLSLGMNVRVNMTMTSRNGVLGHNCAL